VAVPAAVALARSNPIGLLVGGAAKVGGEVTGHRTIEGSAKRTAKAIADQLRVACQRQGWVETRETTGDGIGLLPSRISSKDEP
jgi:hypothetical protein